MIVGMLSGKALFKFVPKKLKNGVECKAMNWEDNVRKVVPYAAGEQPNKPNMIKLNTNESQAVSGS